MVTSQTREFDSYLVWFTSGLFLGSERVRIHFQVPVFGTFEKRGHIQFSG